MSPAAKERLEQRLEEMRSRLVIRSWEYRQRRRSKGVWVRLQVLLAQAARVYVVSEADARALQVEGYEPHPVGAELHPPKTILLVPGHRSELLEVEALPRVALSPRVLEAERLVLVPFAEC